MGCRKVSAGPCLFKGQLGKGLLPRLRGDQQDSVSHRMLDEGPQSSLAVGQRPLLRSGLFNVLTARKPGKH